MSGTWLTWGQHEWILGYQITILVGGCADFGLAILDIFNRLVMACWGRNFDAVEFVIWGLVRNVSGREHSGCHHSTEGMHSALQDISYDPEAYPKHNRTRTGSGHVLPTGLSWFIYMLAYHFGLRILVWESPIKIWLNSTEWLPFHHRCFVFCEDIDALLGKHVWWLHEQISAWR